MDLLPIQGIAGDLVLMPCPGRRPGASRQSLLHEELTELRTLGVTWLVTLMERREMEGFGIGRLGEDVAAFGMNWAHMPIADFCAPDEAFEQQWLRYGPAIQDFLVDGGRLGLHCLAGLGRTGTVAARILVELGYSPPRAVTAVRKARPGSIQSSEQLDYILERRWLAERRKTS